MIDAKLVIEADGSFYPVRLLSIPSAGDVIEFTSHRNMRAKQEPYFFRFEVLRVEHEVQDFIEEDAKFSGSHEINILVKNLALQ
jgi:hypothetical protein